MKEKAMAKLKSADQYLEQHEKIFAVLAVSGLIGLIIPFYWFGLYTVPMADDYSMVLGTHNAWEATHSVSRVLYSALVEMASRFMTWSGSFTDMFVQSLLPGLGDYNMYFLVSWILITLVLFANFYFGKCVIVDVLKTSKEKWLIITSVVTIMQFECIPSVYDAFYWFVGAIGYTSGYAVKLILLGMIIRELAGSEKTTVVKYIMTAAFAFLLGGTDYGATSVSLICVFGCMWIWGIYTKRKRTYIFLITLSFMAAWVIGLLAPGNAVRAELLPESRGFLFSIQQALIVGAMKIYQWVSPYMIIMPLLFLPFLISALKQCKYRFYCPAVISFLSYGIFSSVYAPTIYANYGAIGDVTGYTNNAIYLIFVVLWVFNLTYWIGWILQRFSMEKQQDTEDKKRFSISLYYISAVTLVCMMVCVAHIPRDYNSFELFHWIRTGTMQENKQAYLAREKIYKNSVGQDVVVSRITPPIASTGGGDITQDPNNWVNQCIAAYYGMKSVRLE